jgi:hypothetical protein
MGSGLAGPKRYHSPGPRPESKGFGNGVTEGDRYLFGRLPSPLASLLAGPKRYPWPSPACCPQKAGGVAQSVAVLWGVGNVGGVTSLVSERGGLGRPEHRGLRRRHTNPITSTPGGRSLHLFTALSNVVVRLDEERGKVPLSSPGHSQLNEETFACILPSRTPCHLVIVILSLCSRPASQVGDRWHDEKRWQVVGGGWRAE